MNEIRKLWDKIFLGGQGKDSVGKICLGCFNLGEVFDQGSQHGIKNTYAVNFREIGIGDKRQEFLRIVASVLVESWKKLDMQSCESGKGQGKEKKKIFENITPSAQDLLNLFN